MDTRADAVLDQRFNLAHFINCEREVQRFEQLLRFENTIRILAIQDRASTGKTYLLNLLYVREKTEARRIPISLISFKEPSIVTEFDLVKLLRKRFKLFGVPFSSFDRYYDWRTLGDIAAMKSAMILENNDFKDAQNTQIATTILNRQGPGHVTVVAGAPLNDLTPEQQLLADQLCIKAFFRELSHYCQSKPAVIVLDDYQLANDRIAQWMINELFAEHFSNLTDLPAHLLLIVAGQRLPNFEDNWPQERLDAVVCRVPEMPRWTAEDIKKCTRIHGGEWPPDRLDMLLSLASGLPPGPLVEFIKARSERQDW